MRPDACYQDMREAGGVTGNVEENKSLYWNPVIYKVTLHLQGSIFKWNGTFY